ncbi:hypothetical protein AAHA92_25147 [Salvia divinorum]|uniref:Uncharacterized protein n=1 Tax=Salvia divinorum TaxID=28513 RepID=A0ABD1G9P0_SALDI
MLVALMKEMSGVRGEINSIHGDVAHLREQVEHSHHTPPLRNKNNGEGMKPHPHTTKVSITMEIRKSGKTRRDGNFMIMLGGEESEGPIGSMEILTLGG